MSGLSARQEKWFASIKAGLERDTGKSLEAWVEIARGCPHDTHRKRLAWLKEVHGVGVNRGSTILAAAFPADAPGWDDPDALRAALWREPAGEAVLAAVEARMAALPDVAFTQRKTYSAFARSVQFAAARPLKGGRALLGLKLEPEASPRLSAPARKESWSERLTAVVELSDPAEVDDELAALIRRAWERG